MLLSLIKYGYFKISSLFLIILLFSSCSNFEYSNNRQFGQKRIELIYGSNFNMYLENKIFLKDPQNIEMLLHEYAHFLYFKIKKPNSKLSELLNKEYEIPPLIIETKYNRELQDFITTSTRWKIKYSFKHSNQDINIEAELMSNLFVIFTLNKEELNYIKINYPEIYIEYKKYYDSFWR